MLQKKMQAQMALIALSLTAPQLSWAAGASPQPEFQAMSPQDLHAPLAKLSTAKAAPVLTEMHATLRADGSVDLRCAERHQHPHDQQPKAEPVR